MKNKLLIPALLLSQILFAQNKKLYVNYPVITNATITDYQGIPIDINWLAPNQTVLYSFNLLNMSEYEVVQAGDFEITIAVDKNIKPVLQNNLDANEHISWKVVPNGKEGSYLIGRFKINLPAAFIKKFNLKFQCSGTGTSNIKISLQGKNEKIAATNILWYTIATPGNK